MIEISSIFLSLLIYLVLFSFPINYFYVNKFFSRYEINFFDVLSLNVIIFLNLCLLFSFFEFNLRLVFLLILFVSIIFFLLNFKNYFFFFKDNQYFFFLFITISLLLFIWIAKISILSWDGAAHWFFKAQNFFQGAEIKNLINLPLSYHPHLGSYVWAFFWKNSLLNIEYFGRFFFIFIFLISIFSLGQQLNKNYTHLEKILITSVFIYLTTDISLFGGYQEYLVFFIFFIISRIFFFLKKNKMLLECNNVIKFIIPCVVLITNLVLWVKQEGFFYYLFLNLIFLIHFKIKTLYKFLHILIFSFVLFVNIFLKINFYETFEFSQSAESNFYYLVNNFNSFVIFNKIILISKYVLISFFKYPIWIILLLSSLILFFKYNFFKNHYYLFSIFIICFSFIYYIYIQVQSDINYELSLSLSRLLFPITGFFIFLIIELLNKFKN